MRLAQARVHFIGIGGIGMCGLAELLHNMGAKVSGSDLNESTQTQRLRSMGITVQIGHRAENIADSEVVVFSSAVRNDNVEFREARRLKIPLIPRAEALAEMMRLKRGVAIGGTHGKTTTTSLTASVFLAAVAKPTIVVGGRLDLIQSTALLGQGEWLVAEADESDGSFLRLSPEIVIITNIDNDHLDHYGSMENVKRAFYDFALRIPFFGRAIVCGDDPVIREIFSDFPKRILFYGFGGHNDLQIKGENSTYSVWIDQKEIGRFRLQIPGRHNALNAAAALAAGLEAGFSFAACSAGLNQFAGVDRRFQLKGEAQGVSVFDDYGHHPTEIRAVLSAARERFPNRRLVVVFQPHRYSRTQLCWDQFLTCFEGADRVYLCEIYPAGEAAIAQISSERLVNEIKHTNVHHLKDVNTRAGEVARALKPGDVMITLGAGDVHKVATQVLEILNEKPR